MLMKKNGDVYTLYTAGKRHVYILYTSEKTNPHRNFFEMRLAILLSRR